MLTFNIHKGFTALIAASSCPKLERREAERSVGADMVFLQKSNGTPRTPSAALQRLAEKCPQYEFLADSNLAAVCLWTQCVYPMGDHGNVSAVEFQIIRYDNSRHFAKRP